MSDPFFLLLLLEFLFLSAFLLMSRVFSPPIIFIFPCHLSVIRNIFRRKKELKKRKWRIPDTINVQSCFASSMFSGSRWCSGSESAYPEPRPSDAIQRRQRRRRLRLRRPPCSRAAIRRRGRHHRRVRATRSGCDGRRVRDRVQRPTKAETNGRLLAIAARNSADNC